MAIPGGDEVVAVSSDDWDQHWHDYADSTERNPAQMYRRKLIFENLAVTEPEPRMLDIGSGQGDLAAEMRSRYPAAHLLGLELSQAGVDRARDKVPDATFIQQDLLGGLAVPDPFRGWATHAVCSEVLEHVDEPEKLLRNVRAFLSPGCRVVITVPGGPRSAFDRHIGHRRHYQPDSLRQLLDDAGFEVELVSGAGFPFFNLYRLVVVLRGQRLVDDVAASDSGQLQSRVADLVMRGFTALFRLNRDRSRRGWQMVAVCREPG